MTGQDFFKHIKEEQKKKYNIVNENEYIDRLKLCQECDHYKNGQCDYCNCITSIKARFKNSHCHDNKW